MRIACVRTDLFFRKVVLASLFEGTALHKFHHQPHLAVYYIGRVVFDDIGMDLDEDHASQHQLTF
jgi:hypothetical protein